MDHIKGDRDTSRGRSSEQDCLLGWIGSGGDATSSCVDEGSLTQAAAPYITGTLQKGPVSNDSPETSVDPSANESATEKSFTGHSAMTPLFHHL